MARTHAPACYRELGAELRKRREAAGVTGVELADRTGWTQTKISRIESGHLPVSTVDLLIYLGFCEIYRGQALDVLAMCRAAERVHGYWLNPHEPGLEDTLCSLIYHESTASGSLSYEPEIVPGLLQTESYIRAMIADRWPHLEPDAAVRVRLERQQVLHRPRPRPFTFFINENAFRLEIGDAAIMHEQLLALTLLDTLPHITIRVIPASVRVGGAFRMFTFTEHLPLVYLDTYGGGIFLEDNEYVNSYRELIPALALAALDEGESREFVAALAYDHDRGSAHDRVEEKQL
ncbi:MAG TPA: helix-turn-helix transcriptional regulator [Actinophytocola sp.]|uniref:helix-turn-helix domain-containing protein n=1 Tax=Actinophytocola sp. TaxID=1872138 RepID=UPI002DDCBD49|nr:helix-turn-helix transcriptional regulator [Actinophytocola sp.]HEV2780277.1 helix-turn-helix transcriptional regulator [Actinophytocola sp.]